MFFYLDLNLFSFCQICMYIIVELHIAPFLSSLCSELLGQNLEPYMFLERKGIFLSSSLLVARKTAENMEWRIHQHVFIFKFLLHFSVFSPTTALSISLIFVLALVYYHNHFNKSMEILIDLVSISESNILWPIVKWLLIEFGKLRWWLLPMESKFYDLSKLVLLSTERKGLFLSLGHWLSPCDFFLSTKHHASSFLRSSLVLTQHSSSSFPQSSIWICMYLWLCFCLVSRRIIFSYKRSIRAFPLTTPSLSGFWKWCPYCEWDRGAKDPYNQSLLLLLKSLYLSIV